MAKLEIKLECRAISGTSFSSITQAQFQKIMGGEYWQEGLLEVINMQQIEIISTASEYAQCEITFQDFYKVYFPSSEGIGDPDITLDIPKLPVTEWHRFQKPVKFGKDDVIILYRDSYKGYLAGRIDLPDTAVFDPKKLSLGVIDLPGLSSLIMDERVKFLIDYGAIPDEQNYRSIIYDGIEESFRAEILGWRVSEYVTISWSTAENAWVTDQVYFD